MKNSERGIMGVATAKLMLVEREMQFAKGYSLEHDDRFVDGELLRAALAYVCTPGDALWPLPSEYRPSKDPIFNLVAAGALLAAEGDRLQRRREAGLPVASGMIVLGMEPDDVASVVDGLREVNKAARELKSFHA